MWKKIIFGFILLVLGLMYWQVNKALKGSKETITADLSSKTLYETRCGVCHGGGSPEAPGLDALKLLPEDYIVQAMTTGVMQNQASTLSNKQHRELAAFISQADQSTTNSDFVKGYCDVDNIGEELAASIQLDDWGIGIKNQRYISKTKINATNVSDLKLSWVFGFPNASRARVQPTISGNTLFTASALGTIYALNRRTGCILWTFQADAEVRSALVIGRDSLGKAERLFFGDFNANVYAFDLASKKLLWKVKINDHPAATITGTLSLFEDRIYVPVSSTEIISAVDESYPCCSFRGSMVSLNVVDGSTVWKTFTIEEVPYEQGKTKKGTAILAPSGAPIWTAVTIDEKRRCLYVGTGENYTRPSTLTSDAIMAFSLDDGKVLWTQQTIEKDAWNGACVTLSSRGNCPEDNGPDADFGAPPILVETDQGDLILAGQKSGHVYAMDPDNDGQIRWTSLVGRGGTMGGIHWGMATDEKILYVPINDRGMYALNKDKPKSPGLHALNISDGQLLWSTIEEDRCPPLSLRGCGPGISAAITLTPEVVFGGTLDGYLKAYSTTDGRELWSFDTKQDYESVNKVKAFGGAIDSDGPIIIEDQVFVTSGYAKFGEKEGNVLLAFELNN